MLEINNLRDFFKYVNNKIVSKSGIDVLNDGPNTPVTDDLTKANLSGDF